MMGLVMHSNHQQIAGCKGLVSRLEPVPGADIFVFEMEDGRFILGYYAPNKLVHFLTQYEDGFYGMSNLMKWGGFTIPGFVAEDVAGAALAMCEQFGLPWSEAKMAAISLETLAKGMAKIGKP